MNKLIAKFKLNRIRNARKWKHLQGGLIKALEGTKLDWSSLFLLGMNVYSTVNKNLSLDKLAEGIIAKSKAEEAKARLKAYSDFLKGFNKTQTIDQNGNIINHSNIEASNQAYNYAQSINFDNSESNSELLDIEKLKSDNLDSLIGNIGDLASLGVGLLANKSTTRTNSTTAPLTNSNFNINDNWKLNLNPQYWTSNYGSNFKFNLK